MIERAFVHVGGSPGSGKTTFIEAMLAGADALTLAARCLRDDTLAQARESAPRTHARASPLPRRPVRQVPLCTPSRASRAAPTTSS